MKHQGIKHKLILTAAVTELENVNGVKPEQPIRDRERGKESYCKT